MVHHGQGYAKSGVLVVEKITALDYAISQPGIIVHYLRLCFWPRGLCLDYGWPVATTAGEIIPPLLLVVALLALTVWAIFRWPAWGFLGGWFFLILAPTSSVFPIKDLAFEHRMYLPLAAVATSLVIGGFLAGEWLVGRGAISLRASRVTGVLFATLVAIALAVLTFGRNMDYRSELSIWEDTVANTPGNERAQNNLGLALQSRGQLDKAIAHLKRAVEIKPDYAPFHNNLGGALNDCGRFGEAIAHYEKALQLMPDLAEAHNNLGLALVAVGRPNEAIAHYQRALEIKPDYAEAYYNLGNALSARGELDQAIADYQKALEINPDFADACNNLGGALLKCGRVDEAITQYEKALEINPDFAGAHYNLGLALAGRGQIEEAIRHYHQALNVKPDHEEALNSLAWLHATCPEASFRNGARATELAERAMALSRGRNPNYLDTLAAAYAETGQFSEAVKTVEQALALATSQNNTALAETLRARIKLYQAGSPYRDTQQPPASPSGHP